MRLTESDVIPSIVLLSSEITVFSKENGILRPPTNTQLTIHSSIFNELKDYLFAF